jgi:hypothetical protein
LNIFPEDAVEFAQHMGIDAIPCEISWQLGPLTAACAEDPVLFVRRAFPPPALASQLSMLENLLIAAEGTGVGVYARFSSFFETALHVLPVSAQSFDARSAFVQNPRLEKVLDLLVKHQERIMRALCDRFGRELCFVSVQDDLLMRPDVVADDQLFQHVLLPRLERMISPAREHRLPVALDTSSIAELALPGLYKIGINFIQAVGPDLDDLERFAGEWRGRLAFSGSLPADLFANSSKAQLDEQARSFGRRFSKQLGFLFSVDDPVADESNEFLPQNLVNALRAIQRFARYA